MKALQKTVLALLSAVLSMAQVKVPDPLAVARQHYNDEQYDQAIAAATQAQRTPASEPAATLVLARAHLERYRVSHEPVDLTGARDALKKIDGSKLGSRDHVEYLIGLGESVFLDEQYNFDDRYSVAAEQFEMALGRAVELDARGRDLLFDWWALSLDRQAQQGPEAGRHALYDRVLKRSMDELALPDGAVAAWYWLAASARGADDLVRAVGAAGAAWQRSAALGGRGEALRTDLDRLMQQVILPERAKQLAGPGTDARLVFAHLQSQWADFRQKWAPPAPETTEK